MHDIKTESGDTKQFVSISDAAASKDSEETKLPASAAVKEETVEKEPKTEIISYDWAVDVMKDYVPDLIEHSAKMEIFFCIVNQTINMGDRMLIFSQSLLTLNLIERFLHMNPTDNQNGSTIRWAKNYTYFRKHIYFFHHCS